MPRFRPTELIMQPLRIAAYYDQLGTATGIGGDTTAAQRVSAAALCRQPARHGAATLPPVFD